MFKHAAQTDDDRDWWLPVRVDAQRLEAFVKSDPDAFRSEINGWIARSRESLQLDPPPAPV